MQTGKEYSSETNKKIAEAFGKMSKDKKKFVSDKQVFPHYRWRIVSSEFKKYAPDYDFSVLESKRAYS